MNDLFHRFEFIRAYIDDIFILTKGDWTYHVQKPDLTLNKLKGKGLQCNIEKSFFRQTRMEYLGFGVTCDGIKPICKKIESNNKYEATYFPKRSTEFYRCNKQLPLYVAKAVTYIISFN